MAHDLDLAKKVLAVFESFGTEGASLRELSYALGDDAPPRTDIRRTVKRLCRDGSLARVERDLYVFAAAAGREFEGTLHFSRGTFFVQTDEGVVRVRSSDLGDALSGDVVKGEVHIESDPPMGAVTEVVAENTPRELVVQITRFRGMFVGESESFVEPVQIVGSLPEGVGPGSLTRVRITGRKPFRRGAAPGYPSHCLVATHVDASQPKRHRVDKQEMLRHVDPDSLDAGVVLDQLAQGLGADAPFPDEAIAQAQAGRAPESATGDGCDDLTHIAFATIDGADAKDFDDAVFAEPVDGGAIRLWVAIADVSHYVPEDSALDVEARRRGCSVYLPGRVYPMLPPHLSDDVCSLRPDVLRRCSYVTIDVADDGSAERVGIGFGVIRSHARLTYAKVQAYLDGGELDAPESVATSVRLLEQLRLRRFRFRRKRGMLDLDLPEPQVVLSADRRRVVGMEASPRWDANRLIEECMLLANETVAHFLLEAGWPTIYRVHGSPDPAKIAALRPVLNDVARDARVPADPTPRDLERALEHVAGTDAGRVLSGLVLRVLPRAEYAVERKIHFGLGTDLYLHYTSPIRRYPDLEVHRMVRRAVELGRAATSEEREVLVPRLVESADLSNQGEGIQTQAERTSDRMMRALYMKPRVGETFEAVITDVVRFGFFVTVREPYVDGLVPIGSIGRDYYEYDDRRARLVGSRSGAVYQVGDTVEVICVSVDVREGNVNFELTASSSDNRRGGRNDRGRNDRGRSDRGRPKGGRPPKGGGRPRGGPPNKKRRR